MPRPPRLYGGLDPGGKKAFGWALLTDEKEFKAAGVVSNAGEAVDALFKSVKAQGGTLVAVGIDAPLLWKKSGESRQVDQVVRDAMQESKSSVQAVNSLRGACLAQGPLAANLMFEKDKNVVLTEAHPKALLKIRDSALSEILGMNDVSEHVRDAALGALTAWHMFNKTSGWRDISEDERDAVTLFGYKAAYWMPIPKK